MRKTIYNPVKQVRTYTTAMGCLLHMITKNEQWN